MTPDLRPTASTRATRVIDVPAAKLFMAFIDPIALAAWLPPGEMVGKIHHFDPRIGGGYRMSLYYPPTVRAFQGKTSKREDRVDVRFVEVEPPRRLVEAVNFVTDDPAFMGEMTMVVTFEEVNGGTEVTILCENLPRGLRPEDNEEGSRLSLEQLDRFARTH